MSDSMSDQELDAHDARADFKNLLQGIIDKANAGESLVPAHSSNEDEKEYEDSSKGPATPSKMSRKRRKKEDQKEEKLKSNSFIMKLFDRSVDLSAFNDQTSLYPICRAWMENDPSGKNKLKQTNGQHDNRSNPDEENITNSDDDETSGNVAEIPPPNVPWNNIDENGEYRSPRIPKPLPQPRNNLDMHFLTQTSAPPPAETLLVNHLRHWRKVRDTWKQKSLENESRYQDGMDILKDVFQRNMYNNSTS